MAQAGRILRVMQPTPRDIISTWAALIGAAQSGDAEARAFLRMFEPVAAEALGWSRDQGQAFTRGQPPTGPAAADGGS